MGVNQSLNWCQLKHQRNKMAVNVSCVNEFFNYYKSQYIKQYKSCPLPLTPTWLIWNQEYWNRLKYRVLPTVGGTRRLHPAFTSATQHSWVMTKLGLFLPTQIRTMGIPCQTAGLIHFLGRERNTKTNFHSHVASVNYIIYFKGILEHIFVGQNWNL
jgi:hypothetical protein